MDSYEDMKFKISSGNLFEGLAEIIAKQVEENSVSNLNIGTKLPNQTEMIGNTVVKTEEPTVEFQIVEGFKVKLDLYDAQPVRMAPMRSRICSCKRINIEPRLIAQKRKYSHQ